MEATELYLICGVAFLIVFLILAILALLMRIIILIFPEKVAEVDAAMIGAAGYWRYQAGQSSDWELDVVANLRLGQNST